MKLAKASETNLLAHSGPNLEAAEIRPAISATLADYLEKNPMQIFVAGPLSKTVTDAGLTLGSPLNLGKTLQLHPMAWSTSWGVPIGGVGLEYLARPSPQDTSLDLVNVLGGLSDRLQGMTEEYPELDDLQLVSVVLATLQTFKACAKPGPKDNLEIVLCAGDAVGSLAEVATDYLHVLKSVEPAIGAIAFVLKQAKKLYVTREYEALVGSRTK